MIRKRGLFVPLIDISQNHFQVGNETYVPSAAPSKRVWGGGSKDKSHGHNLVGDGFGDIPPTFFTSGGQTMFCPPLHFMTLNLVISLLGLYLDVA